MVLACAARSEAWPWGRAATPAEISRAIDSLRAGADPAPGPGSSAFVSALCEGLYRRRAFEPLWTDPAAFDDLVAGIVEAVDHGLEPSDYDLGFIVASRRDEVTSSRAAAELDLRQTSALVRLAWDLRYGRVPVSRLGGKEASEARLLGDDPFAEIEDAVRQGRIREFLASLAPEGVLYGRLRSALGELRRIEAAGGWPAFPPGPTLKPGARDERVAALRRRLAASGDLPAEEAGDPNLYDDAVEGAVRAFQQRHGLEPDGVAGPRTQEALGVAVAARIDQVRATLERCRWVLRDLPPRFVLVNAAAFQVLLIEDGRAVWTSRVIVGKPYTKTPLFRATIRSILLNPTWTVPESIVRGELLPALRRDPRHLEKQRIRRIEGQYVQEPGPHNALGRLKFEMPNRHSVYLHDTPSRSLFARTTRTFSHGCVRVERPLELAALLLDDPAWSAASLAREIETGRTRRLQLREKVPVFVLYWSVTFDAGGRVEFLPDVYGLDEEILGELGRSR